ncbi:50S ribosomal protein L21, mitochondrial-like [Camellia sinensis]|uniref:50S ribosomal protein L21, mitochondrial-like n=1 Tax=Camellia sinensis TaxID=4442 RepID=UPI0010360C2A|nr:50S ribosomal protein L21, mitochondrial-like [Camellia sinensis]
MEGSQQLTSLPKPFTHEEHKHSPLQLPDHQLGLGFQPSPLDPDQILDPPPPTDELDQKTADEQLQNPQIVSQELQNQQQPICEELRNQETTDEVLLNQQNVNRELQNQEGINEELQNLVLEEREKVSEKGLDREDDGEGAESKAEEKKGDREVSDDDAEGIDGGNDSGDDDDDDDESVSASNCGVKREYTSEEKEEEAAAIGYKVIGPLERSDRVFKPYELVFAVVQIGSHQFKVSNGDCIYTERLKFCEVNNKLILNKVLMLGSQSQTIIGRPILPDAAVHAVVEEHALDAKVIIFKKKRRKNYRRTKGHRQELTKLRITDIRGLEKPEMTVAGKMEKVSVKKLEKVAVAA